MSGILGGLGTALAKIASKVRGMSSISKELVEELIYDLRRSLLLADVNVELVNIVCEKVEKRALEEEIPRGISPRYHVIRVLYEELASLLGTTEHSLKIKSKGPTILMLVGIQGSGKTTTTAKLARILQKRGYRLAAIGADTYRPGARDQLSQLLSPIDIPLYSDPKEKNPAKIAKRGVENFSKSGFDIILIDTAGRHKEEQGLIQEMRSIADRTQPDEIILVLDGTIGQQAYAQADAFNKATSIGSIVVTKLDGAAKGGGAISAAAATGAPIKFIGTGERMDDLEIFSPQKFVGNLLGLGDLESILKRIQDAGVVSEEEVMRAFMSGKFTLRHLYQQIQQFQGMGRVSQLLSGLPGVGPSLPPEFDDMSKENMKKWIAVLESMTDEELDNPRVLRKNSRVNRIARGSGTSEIVVKQLLKQYDQTRKLMKQMRGQRRFRRQKVPWG
ncbi:MAG: signal recognition particle receptor subunit alpha [Candidatus Hodarchaeales archaeon]|jgi:signal recognition particle subunit SRP54